jgi:hypothetical protein
MNLDISDNCMAIFLGYIAKRIATKAFPSFPGNIEQQRPFYPQIINLGLPSFNTKTIGLFNFDIANALLAKR